jgi:micrococcal nuclease
MAKRLILGLLVIIMLTSVLFSGCIEEKGEELNASPQPELTPSPAPLAPAEQRCSASVTEVTDGDTIELASGERVRLLGINAPEIGQPYYEEARTRLRELIEGKTVTLEKDVEDKDRYGRLLRYVYSDDTFVNLVMIREGYASAYIILPNTKYSIDFEAAEEEAKNAERGLWRSSKESSQCISVANFHWNAEGNDCSNLNDEYVTFKNTCPHTLDLTGWTVQDEANHRYTFPAYTLAGGASVTLHSGPGANTLTELFWDNRGQSCNAVWNNDGDTLFLRDLNGDLILSNSYSGFEQ